MLVKICLFYFEVNITFWVKKSLTSIVWVSFELILPSLLTSAVYDFSRTYAEYEFYFQHWVAAFPGLSAGQVEK